MRSMQLLLIAARVAKGHATRNDIVDYIVTCGRALSSNNICHLTMVAADGITYRRVGYLTINETITIVK